MTGEQKLIELRRRAAAYDELVAALGMIERLLSSHCESNQADQYLDDDALDVARAALARVQA